ncbi:MAG: tetratricopeptide repeat protein [Actinomycetota bacterium]|nr:tetratricopeptide repeat protein [Actinomycetota bacterium]
MRELPRGTVTFLFTDIEGSTRLLHDLGDGYADVLGEHRRLLREAFARNGGVEVDTQGDAFFAAFARASDAVAAAEEGQRALEPGPVRVRIGIHSGEPVVTDEGYVGLDVHRAARIAAAAHGGQVVLSQSARDLAGRDDLRDLGEHRLKDLTAAERIWQLGDTEFPRLKTLYQTNLPVPATPFVGRDCELADASSLLQDGVRLLTLSGPGGTGKTRLALQAAAAAADGYPDGIWWVPLAPLADPALVLPTAGEVIGTQGDLARELGGKRLLLLLDNFEHLIDAAREVGALVAACPNLTVLVTSRERLQVAGEHEYPVPAMASPDGLELFVARARALGTEIAGDHAVRELCERLDNLPLALELAAARTKIFSPAQLLERLSKRLDLFKGGRDADPRQLTLRATIEWSHDLLGTEEQQLFARLSVFAGGCVYDAAEEICDADEDTLQSLLDKSLLRRGEGPAGAPRYWMLETIRQFAAERLDERGEEEALARRHAEWHAELATRLQEPMRDGQADATARLTAEIDNLRGALEWLARHGDARQGLRIVWGLWYFWVTRGLLGEGLRWAHWAVDEAPNAPLEERLFGLLGASEIFRMVGDRSVALELKGSLVSQFRELGNESRVAATLADMAEIHASAGNFAEGRRLGDEALGLRRKLGARWGVAHALAHLGMVEFCAGDFTQARALYEEAVALAEEPSVPTTLAAGSLMAGESARREGDFAGAARLLLRALGLFEELGERGAFPELLQEIAAASPGHTTEAVRLLGASERLLLEMGVERWDPPDYEQTLETLRAELGDAGFGEAWAAGEALSEEEALSLAARLLD